VAFNCFFTMKFCLRIKRDGLADANIPWIAEDGLASIRICQRQLSIGYTCEGSLGLCSGILRTGVPRQSVFVGPT